MEQRIDVAIGVLIGPRGVMITRRRRGDVLGGCWEFPGGKVEPGESPEACLRREFAEELGIAVDVGRPFPPIEHDYAHGCVRLRCFWCSPRPGEPCEPRPLEVAEWRWVRPDDLGQYRFPPANGPLIEEIVATSDCGGAS